MTRKHIPKTSKQLHFDVSTGLKRVIGRELITDSEVAIFELVKNSFDAKAQKVQLYIDHERIVIIDDGKGMSYDDITSKWLFVAYSSKRGSKLDYRDQIAERPFAGSKGVGRFSSDRLGSFLTLQSKPKSEKEGPIHKVGVNWDDFEGDDKRDFVNIKLSYDALSKFDLPSGTNQIRHGTVLEITGLHEDWDRERLQKLKGSLTKLINPFGAEIDKFNMTIIAPGQIDGDKIAVEKAKIKEPKLPPPSREIINGPIQNFIFSTLQEKTTFIEVTLSKDGSYFETALTDRGELVYRIREKNPHAAMANSHFQCQIFYLNLSAKQTFKRRIGIQSTQFGSVFLFKNDFRVFPVGDDGDDWWGLSKRKQQGYARFLGTREVIGRVDVTGDDTTFQEASSRNQGLLKNDATEALKSFVMKKCIQRLEAYVVPVSWTEKADGELSDLSLINTDAGRIRVAKAIAGIVDSQDIELLDYSKKLTQVANERSEQFEESLTNLRSIASKARDSTLMNSIDKAEHRFIELKRAEKEALEEVESERLSRESAEKRAATAEKKAEVAKRVAVEVTEKYDEVRQQNLFLTSVTSLDYDTIVNLHHQIILYGSKAGRLASNKIKSYRGRDKLDVEDVLSDFEQMVFLNQKILAVARFATKANFRLDSGKIEEDVANFIEQYINEIGQEYLANQIRISVDNQANGFVQKFQPIEFSILVENLVSNAKKAKASQIWFEIKQPKKKQLVLRIYDNGRGLAGDIDDPEQIFEKGFSRARGSGLGLYHVRQVLSEMNGSISVDMSYTKGVCFEVRLIK